MPDARVAIGMAPAYQSPHKSWWRLWGILGGGGEGGGGVGGGGAGGGGEAGGGEAGGDEGGEGGGAPLSKRIAYSPPNRLVGHRDRSEFTVNPAASNS